MQSETHLVRKRAVRSNEFESKHGWSACNRVISFCHDSTETPFLNYLRPTRFMSDENAWTLFTNGHEFKMTKQVLARQQCRLGGLAHLRLGFKAKINYCGPLKPIYEMWWSTEFFREHSNNFEMVEKFAITISITLSSGQWPHVDRRPKFKKNIFRANEYNGSN